MARRLLTLIAALALVGCDDEKKRTVTAEVEILRHWKADEDVRLAWLAYRSGASSVSGAGCTRTIRWRRTDASAWRMALWSIAGTDVVGYRILDVD